MGSVCVIGLGYVGLPLALLSAEKGYTVYGLENNSRKAEKLSHEHKTICINHPDALLSDVIIIAVPTPVDESKNPDLSPVRVACEQIVEKLTGKGQLIILESTVNPFISRKFVLPILESSGLVEGKDFFLAHCPERIDPGNAQWNVSNIPRVVGALHEEGLERVKTFYQSILSSEVLPLSSIEAAEMTKIYENSLRAVNIAFANEMAIIMQNMRLDAKEVISGVKTKPFGLDMCSPSCGVGGHCFDKDHVAFYVKDGVFSAATVQEIFENFQSGVFDSLQVLSFNLNTRETSYQSVTHVSKRYSEKIYALRTGGSYTLKVTDLHPVITYNNGSFFVKFAKDVKVGERVIFISLPEVFFPQKAGKSVMLQSGGQFLNRQLLNLGLGVQQHDNFYSLEIEDIKEEEYSDYAYSLEVDTTHTLVVDNGLVAHNCIPVDPFYLIDESLKRGFDPSFLRTAMKVNGYMPSYTVSLLTSALNEVGKSVKGTKVGILGVAYKKNVDDMRESPAIDIIKRVKSLGADLKIYDPFLPEYSTATKDEVLACDAILLLTDHSEFLSYDFSRVPVFIDGKNVLDKSKVGGVYKGIGR